MMPAIDFDDKQCRMAHEVDDKRADRNLPAEAHAVHPMSTDCVPIAA
jgi:hypothetical protein